MNHTRLAKLDDRIAQLRKRLEAAERLREAVNDDPDLLDLLDDSHTSAESMGKVNSFASGVRRRGAKAGHSFGAGPVTQAHFEKVVAFLDTKGNEAQPIPVIAKATGLKPSNVIQVCYRTHKAAFERLSVEGHKTRKAWRLRKGWKELLKSPA